GLLAHLRPLLRRRLFAARLEPGHHFLAFLRDELFDLRLLIVSDLDLLLHAGVGEQELLAATAHAAALTLTLAALTLAPTALGLVLGQRRPGEHSHQAHGQRPLRKVAHRSPPFLNDNPAPARRAHRGPLDGCAAN